MKVVMYHYVRPPGIHPPCMHFLPAEGFRKQLDHFEENGGLITRDQWDAFLHHGTPLPEGYLLTFDDGLSDHYQYVFPELKKRNAVGLFFVSTKPLIARKLLDVSRVHFLLGHLGGEALHKKIRAALSDHMIDANAKDLFSKQSYQVQSNQEHVRAAKQLLNYFIHYDYREDILDEIMRDVVSDEAELVNQFYLTPAQLKEMHNHDMVIANHSHNHFVMGRLSYNDQRHELAHCNDHLHNILGTIPQPVYCHPYGIPSTYNADTTKALQSLNFKKAFIIDPQDVPNDTTGPAAFTLPRYDCNRFAHGESMCY